MTNGLWQYLKGVGKWRTLRTGRKNGGDVLSYLKTEIGKRYSGVKALGKSIDAGCCLVLYGATFHDYINLRLTGWDVAITDDGCKFFEGNPGSGVASMQIADGIGKKDLFYKYLKE